MKTQQQDDPVWSCFTGYARGISYSEAVPLYGRIRGIVPAVAGNLFWGLAFMEGLPAWLSWITGDTFKRVAIAVWAVSLVSLLLLLRRAHKRLYGEHDAMQRLSYLCCRALSRHRKRDKLADFCESFCQDTAQVFAARSRRGTIGCAIRLVRKDGWCTVARGGKLSRRREVSSEPLRKDGELMSMLFHRKAFGCDVFICNDVDKAHELHVLEKDKNSENKFADEVRSMMLGRVKLWDRKAKKETMVGILYVTSSQKGHFNGTDVDMMLSVCELLGMCIPPFLQ